MRHIYIFFVVCSVGLISCSDNKTTEGKQAATAPPAKVTSNLGDTGTHILAGLVNRYFDVKNALVATNAPNIKGAAEKLCLATDSLRTFLQKNNAGNTLLKPYVDSLITSGISVAAITDPTCEKQRLAFGNMTSPLYNMLQKAGMKNEIIYKEYCPMAFNEKGASWLSEEIDIKNPYFGKKMLECGEVTDSLK